MLIYIVYKKIILIFSILFTSEILAGDFTLLPTLLYSTNRSFRGALTWDGPSIGLLPGISYKNFIKTGPGGLNFEWYSNNEFKFFTAIGYFDDDVPRTLLFNLVKLKKIEMDYKNERHGTIETTIGFEYKKAKSFKTTMLYQQNYLSHDHQFTHYTSINISHPTMILPLTSLGIVFDYHEKRSSQYTFGETAKKGLGHVEAKVNLFIPFLPFGGILLMDYTYSRITSRTNQEAHYIQGNDHYTKFTSVASWPINF